MITAERSGRRELNPRLLLGGKNVASKRNALCERGGA